MSEERTWQEVVDHYAAAHGLDVNETASGWWFVSFCDVNRPAGNRHLGNALVSAPTDVAAERLARSVMPPLLGGLFLDVSVLPAGHDEMVLSAGWHDHDELIDTGWGSM